MRIDAPYPSFTSVMLKLDPSLRLPAYRSTHTARYHPYPRGGLRRSEEVFTDPYVHVEERLSHSGRTQPRTPPAARRCALVPDDADVFGFESHLPVVGVEYDEDELQAAGILTGLSRSKLALLLTDLLGALHRAFLDPTLRTMGGFKFGVKLFG